MSHSPSIRLLTLSSPYTTPSDARPSPLVETGNLPVPRDPLDPWGKFGVVPVVVRNTRTLSV